MNRHLGASKHESRRGRLRGRTGYPWTWVAAIAFALLLAGGAGAEPPAGQAAEPPATPVSFARQIRPLLAEHCFSCHGPDSNHREADLRLDTHEGALTVVRPGDSAASDLWRRITSDDPDLRMPPQAANRPLNAQQRELLRQWIEQGAPWGEHWSLAPLERPALPSAVPFPELLGNPLDAFVQRELAARGLRPAPRADRRTLLRRLRLDLTGLPPTADEVYQFVNDQSPDAYARLVDRLLASPEFGERMAWDWLDAARYADSNGYQGDRERTMWPWRDWVVQAFNRNLPFDEFTRWQLAGDLLPDASFEQRLATGFNRNHMINGEGGRIAEENRVDYVMDMTETMGTVWLALTLNCCRCHDHKFDAVSNREYYRLFAIFNQTPVSGGGGDPQTPPVLAAPDARQRAQQQRLQTQLDEVKRELAALPPAANQPQATPDPPPTGSPQETRRAALAASQQELEKQLGDLQKQFPKVMVMADQPNRRETRLLERGLYNQPGEPVKPGTPACLPPAQRAAEPLTRLDLAQWLVSPEHPLTARVRVNRIWAQFFGVGLVKTAEDFGVQGETPQYQQVLDWLAVEFRDGGWDTKALVRAIVTSHTYQQSSRMPGPVPPAAAPPASPAPARDSLQRADYQLDPENRLLGRGPRFRLPSWMIRDQALAAAGLLTRRLGGPGVNSYQPAGVWEEATFGNKKYTRDTGAALYRRSIYTFWRRIIGPTLFFDSAARQTCTVKAVRTNTPMHALTTFNDVTYVEAARVLAAETMRGERRDAARLARVFRRLLAREPRAEEQTLLLRQLRATQAAYRRDDEAAKKLLSIGQAPLAPHLDTAEWAGWTACCLAILNLDETLTKE